MNTLIQYIDKINNSDEKSVKNYLSDLVMLMATQNINTNETLNKVSELLNKIKKEKIVNENIFREIYNFFNVYLDNVIENGRKTLYTYNKENVEKAINHFKTNSIINDKIIITTTCCKRFDLLERTINSFLECVLDYTKYTVEWIVIDDNSSEEDRKKMTTLYPFIRFIMKDMNNKGHPRSMNMIYDEVLNKADYIFNLEDDWEFFIKDNYMEKMVTIIKEKENIGQVLVNINYSEDTKSALNLWGGKMMYTKSGLRYFEHRFYKGPELDAMARKVNYSNCFYWPHFSFRPGITKVEILKKIGKFNESAKHFEMEYAYKYSDKGYITTFLDGTFSSHIGRRTYERNSDKVNAYDLNNEQQFGESHSKSIGKVHDNKNTTNDDKSESNIIECQIHVINLERRLDRLQNFFNVNLNELMPLSIFRGFDGKQIKPTHKIQKAFKSGDYAYRSGIVGCAMSHISLWKKLLKDSTTNYMIVLEDDAKLCIEFKKKILYLLNKYNNQFELMFLHYNPYPNRPQNPELYSNKYPVAEYWSVEKSMKENMGSGAGYIISKDGARNMLKHIEKRGVYNAIDWVMFKSPMDFPTTQRIMYTTPMLVFANCFQNVQGVDTDIQNVYSSLSFTVSDQRSERDRIRDAPSDFVARALRPKDNEWDIYELKYLMDALKNTFYNKDKKLFVNGVCENNLTEYVRKESKDLIVNGLKNPYTIIITNKCDLSQLRDYITILPLNLKDELKKMILSYPIKFYTTDRYIYSLPDKYINDVILNDKVWDDSYLNVVNPF
jgi:GR25 family glycosyltransferase involved in LPS biosynthesis